MCTCHKLIAAVVTLVIGVFARGAAAQQALVADMITDQTYDTSALYALEGHGYALSHGVILRPSLRLEGGGSSNVFYSAPPIRSGILRLSGALYVTNDKPRPGEFGNDADTGDDAAPLDYQFRGGVQLSYVEFLSGSSAVRAQRQFNVLGDASVMTNPSATWSFVVQNQFRRNTSSLTFEDTTTLNRDDNQLSVGARFTSDGGGVSLTVHYENQLQVFENADSLGLPSRMNHTVGLGVQHDLNGDQQTALHADVSYGFFRTFGQSATADFYKSNSQPFRAVAGVARELSPNVNANVEAGFAHASYDGRRDGRTGGYSAPVALAAMAVRWTRTGRLVARYRYDHFDAANANFYRDHTLELKLVQQYEFLVLDGGPEVHFRQYSGMPGQEGADVRNDTIVSARARLQAVLAERYSISLEYRLSRVSTDYVGNTFDAMGNLVATPSYDRHDIFAGFTLAY